MHPEKEASWVQEMNEDTTLLRALDGWRKGQQSTLWEKGHELNFLGVLEDWFQTADGGPGGMLMHKATHRWVYQPMYELSTTILTGSWQNDIHAHHRRYATDVPGKSDTSQREKHFTKALLLGLTLWEIRSPCTSHIYRKERPPVFKGMDVEEWFTSK